MTEKTDYQGIDYGMGQTNIDLETGIRYGVIPVHEVSQTWSDESEAYYPFVCPHCGNDLPGDDLEDLPVNYHDHYFCPSCGRVIRDGDFDMQEPTSFYYEKNGYSAEQSADNFDIFIVKSPYFTYSPFCSPCAPGAGYLMHPRTPETGVKAYCFSHDWFEGGKAPYDVYSVETGELVKGGVAHETDN